MSVFVRPASGSTHAQPMTTPGGLLGTHTSHILQPRHQQRRRPALFTPLPPSPAHQLSHDI